MFAGVLCIDKVGYEFANVLRLIKFREHLHFQHHLLSRKKGINAAILFSLFYPIPSLRDSSSMFLLHQTSCYRPPKPSKEALRRSRILHVPQGIVGNLGIITIRFRRRKNSFLCIVFQFSDAACIKGYFRPVLACADSESASLLKQKKDAIIVIYNARIFCCEWTILVLCRLHLS